MPKEKEFEIQVGSGNFTQTCKRIVDKIIYYNDNNITNTTDKVSYSVNEEEKSMNLHLPSETIVELSIKKGFAEVFILSRPKNFTLLHVKKELKTIFHDPTTAYRVCGISRL